MNNHQVVDGWSSFMCHFHERSNPPWNETLGRHWFAVAAAPMSLVVCSNQLIELDLRNSDDTTTCPWITSFTGFAAWCLWTTDVWTVCWQRFDGLLFWAMSEMKTIKTTRFHKLWEKVSQICWTVKRWDVVYCSVNLSRRTGCFYVHTGTVFPDPETRLKITETDVLLRKVVEGT